MIVIHAKCQTEVEFVERTVVTRPGDQHWPKNVELQLSYCPKCKQLLDWRTLQRVIG